MNKLEKLIDMIYEQSSYSNIELKKVMANLLIYKEGYVYVRWNEEEQDIFFTVLENPTYVVEKGSGLTES